MDLYNKKVLVYLKRNSKVYVSEFRSAYEARYAQFIRKQFDSLSE